MVQDGRAQVLPERCVACGNCIRVRSQKAKRVESDDLDAAKGMIAAGERVVACLAPSFPASFPNVRPRQVVEAARRLGFTEVMEVAAGAELVAHAYERLAAGRDGKGPLITTPCPALVSYVEKHLPGVLPFFAPVVSPMVTLARLVKHRLDPTAKVVFIGPCLAKKVEARDPNLIGDVDAVLTFLEFTSWLAEAGVEMASLPEGEFDGPHPSVSRIFPVPGRPAADQRHAGRRAGQRDGRDGGCGPNHGAAQADREAAGGGRLLRPAVLRGVCQRSLR
jgi:iron only hydrogenase large subunit-like protein